MKAYGVNELRRMFLEFFESKGHLAMKSFSLVPHNDNSLLLINSGMAPLKPYFTGQEIPPRRRVTTCQKCIRTGDIENIGKTARHGTFFEMLGNFSFGDYFKHEAIAWSWEFLTQVVGLDPDRLYPSVYENDDEAFAIWQNGIGFTLRYIWMMTRLLKSGTRKSASRRRGSSALAKRTTSGSMAQAPAVPALRFIMTAAKNTAAASLDVPLAATATDIWKYGITYSPSLIMTATATTAN